jgi:MATE family multidrug resistance protein
VQAAVKWFEPDEIKKVLHLAFPLILSNLTQPVLIATDTVLAGHQPSAAVLGGVTLGGMFFSTIFWSFGFLRMSTTGLVAQAFGASEERASALHSLRAIVLGLLFGAVILLLQAPLIDVALRLLGGSAEVTAQARIYCRILIWSAPAVLVNYAVLGTLLGRQRARLALLLQGAIQVVNLAVAIALVLGFGWGIEGIATGTLASEWAGCLLGIALAARLLNWRALSWRELAHARDLWHLFHLNRDIFLRTLSLVAAFSWFIRHSAQAGDAVLAANAVLLNLQSIAAYGLDGFANATEALVGEAVGARSADRFRRVLRASTICAALTALVFTLLFAVLGTHLIPLFTTQPAVRAAACRYLPWLVALPLIAVWGYQCDGVFIGATRSRDLRNSMILALAGFLALSFPFCIWWSNDGLWAAFLIFMALRGITLGLRLRTIPAAMID